MPARKSSFVVRRGSAPRSFLLENEGASISPDGACFASVSSALARHPSPALQKGTQWVFTAIAGQVASVRLLGIGSRETMRPHARRGGTPDSVDHSQSNSTGTPKDPFNCAKLLFSGEIPEGRAADADANSLFSLTFNDLRGRLMLSGAMTAVVSRTCVAPLERVKMELMVGDQ